MIETRTEEDKTMAKEEPNQRLGSVYYVCGKAGMSHYCHGIEHIGDVTSTGWRVLGTSQFFLLNPESDVCIVRVRDGQDSFILNTGDHPVRVGYSRFGISTESGPYNDLMMPREFRSLGPDLELILQFSLGRW